MNPKILHGPYIYEFDFGTLFFALFLPTFLPAGDGSPVDLRRPPHRRVYPRRWLLQSWTTGPPPPPSLRDFNLLFSCEVLRAVVVVVPRRDVEGFDPSGGVVEGGVELAWRGRCGDVRDGGHDVRELLRRRGRRFSC